MYERKKFSYTTAVVIIPPPELWPIIRAIDESDKRTGRWMPHITLLYPFEEQAAFGLALPQLQEVCDTIDTFTISFLSFDVFRDGSPFTLYLKPQTSVEGIIEELQNKLQKQFPACKPHNLTIRRFVPHITVGQSDTLEEADQRISKLTSEWKGVSFEVDCIYVITRPLPDSGEPDVFSAKHTIPLRGGKKVNEGDAEANGTEEAGGEKEAKPSLVLRAEPVSTAAESASPLRLTLSKNGNKKPLLLEKRQMKLLQKSIQQKFRSKAKKIVTLDGTVVDEKVLMALEQDAVLLIT